MKKLIPRTAGILAHPTSFFTPYGIGDLGSAAFEFIKYIKNSGQEFWQILPLGPTGYLDSPYQCLSAFAGNPLLIAPDGLIKINLITKEQVLDLLSDNSEKSDIKHWAVQEEVDFAEVRRFKYQILKTCYAKFKEEHQDTKSDLYLEFREFCNQQKEWLEEFVLFYSLKQAHNLQSWVKWPKEYRDHQNEAMTSWKSEKADELNYYRFIQFLFDRQWKELHDYCTLNKMKIIGDMPIFVAHDSVDVWAHRDLFTLNPDGSLNYQAGVPPDYFSKTGQLWGNPLYRWDKKKKELFDWFIKRFRRLLELVDWIRIDHFRGFEAYWRVEGEAKNAIKGKWIKAPGDDLFKQLKTELGEIPIIAENLGVITEEVETLRKKYYLPGMAVLQFAFSSDATNPHLPHNYEINTLAYSGTHDNNTILGWWQNDADSKERRYFKEYFNTEALNISEDLISSLYRSVARLAIIPIQDFIGQGEEARMNTPSVPEGNWKYRMPANALNSEKKNYFNKLTKIYGRDHIHKLSKK